MGENREVLGARVQHSVALILIRALRCYFNKNKSIKFLYLLVSNLYIGKKQITGLTEYLKIGGNSVPGSIWLVI